MLWVIPFLQNRGNIKLDYVTSSHMQCFQYIQKCYHIFATASFCPFWPGQMLVQHLIDTLDSTNLESGDAIYVAPKLYSTRLYNSASHFRHLQKVSVHCHHCCSMSYWKSTLSKQFLIVVRVVSIHTSAVKCVAGGVHLIST